MRRRTRPTSTQDQFLGPGFTTRQLTAIVVAFALAIVLFPVGARAAGQSKRRAPIGRVGLGRVGSGAAGHITSASWRVAH